MILKNIPVLFTLGTNYSASEELYNESIYKTAEDNEVLFFSQNSYTSHDSRIGEYSYCDAVKLMLQNQELKIARISFQALCLYIAYYSRI
jgi:hypothetical protein